MVKNIFIVKTYLSTKYFIDEMRGPEKKVFQPKLKIRV